MKRVLALVVGCLLLAACTTTNVRVASAGLQRPAAGARVLVLQPEVQLAVLTAGGVNEARADWSQAGQENLAREIEAQLKSRSHGFTMLDPEAAMSGRTGQLMRLNAAVGQSILLHNYMGLALPTKPTFDWTLGDGASRLADEQGADYALFVNARGNYASGGRVATAIGMAMLGVSVPMGQQQVMASLVDLRTGKVVWFNVATAGPNADMREAAGAARLTTSLLKEIPL
jgi:outer membrane biogenesis lipoprotein LolB